MLTNTFLHLPGVGTVTERRLWKAGCDSWDTALAKLDKFSFGTCAKADAQRTLHDSQQALEAKQHQYFVRRLKQIDAWRCYEAFRQETVYLDIETDGRDITMVGLFDGTEFTCLVKDDDLGNLPDHLSKYSTIVSFAGIMFDLPQIQRQFRSMPLDHIHIDLCPILKQINIRGGLKKIEKLAGIERPEHLADLRGWDAVKLWRRYQHLRDEEALDTLIAYNREDVVNLEKLIVWAMPKLVASAKGEVSVQPTSPGLFDDES